MGKGSGVRMGNALFGFVMFLFVLFLGLQWAEWYFDPWRKVKPTDFESYVEPPKITGGCDDPY